MMYLSKGTQVHNDSVTSEIEPWKKKHVGQLDIAVSGIVRTTGERQEI